MSNLMQQCIDLQPDALRRVLGKREELIEPFIAFLGDLSLRQIHLVGSGSSYHAAMMARVYMEEVLEIPVYVATPTQLNYIDSDEKDTSLVVVLSQSGQSTNTIKAIKAFQKKGYSVAALTMEANSPVAQQADFFLALNCGEETADQKTMGVVASVLTLQILAVELAKRKGLLTIQEGEVFYQDAQLAAMHMEENLIVTKQWYLENATLLQKCTYILICGMGTLAPIGGEGALKLVETIYLPTFAYDFEEFIHGPTALFNDKTYMFFLTAHDDDNARMQKLQKMCESVGGNAFSIELTKDVPSYNEKTLSLQGEERRCFAPYALLLPLQVISAYLSEDLGIDIDKSPFPHLASDLDTKTT